MLIFMRFYSTALRKNPPLLSAEENVLLKRKASRIISMGNYSETILTNMCMVYDGKGRFLVQNRLKQDWPGLNFPGGHVEKEESIVESVIREMKEETGLAVANLEPVGYFEWNVPSKNIRHVSLLFRTKTYLGVLKGSAEGPVFWIAEKELGSYPQAVDFDKVYGLMKKDLKN